MDDELKIEKSLMKINKTLKNQPDEKKSPKKRVTKKKSPVEKKSPRKPKRKLKLVELAPKLSIDEYEIMEKVQPEELDELVPILHMDNNRERPINAKHNKTVKKLNIIDNDNNINQDKMASKVKLAKKIVEDFQNNGITVLESLTEEELVTVIEGNNHAYYNTNKPLTSDNEYDIIKEYMERKYPKNTIITEVGAKIIKNKVELPYKMASMDKIKPDTNALTKWTTTYKGPYVLSCKLDGVSGLYTTEGEIPKLYTRGNGTIGQDISHLIPVLNLPTEKNSVIRGEFIIPRLVFEEKYKKRFANARNLVSGIVNSKKIDEKTQDLHFVAYEVIQPSLKPSEQMKKIEELGHISVQNQTVDNLTNEMLSGILMDWRTNYEYEIDGVIVTNDRVYTRTDGNPDYAFAFKMVISDQVAEAKVVDVIWTPSKSGYLKPRVRIEPIKLGGVTIEYATGFNGKFIEENKIGIGAIIQIIRSGDVIPYIKSVTTPAEHAKMPVTEYHWTDSHVDLVLDNVTDDETVQEKNITDFFTGIEVESLSTGNVKKIMKAGYRTIPDILKMTKDDFEKVDGFKEKMVNKIYEGIQSKIERASLITIMASSNKFGRGIGKRKITPIMNKYPNILVSDENVNEKIAMLQLIEGIGKENAKGFVNNINNFISFLEECNLHHKLGNTKIEATAETDVEINNGQIHDESNPLYGKYIVMTKVRDAEIIDYLKKVGGHLDNNISKKTFILVVKSLDDVSNKTKKANADNIPIMTPEMFKTEYINT
uniref:DNA ligase (NAD(+)) n=1 Tax=viral metagenome TaxID=1070528 RepID=A0A6C0J0V5_9ZZZZ